MLGIWMIPLITRIATSLRWPLIRVLIPLVPMAIRIAIIWIAGKVRPLIAIRSWRESAQGFGEDEDSIAVVTER